jgi:peptidoglycan hydrolase-like protein with peptidoglycan-binding domain
MRFKEFRTVLKEAENNVVIIGDSIAVGIGGAEPYAKGGISTTEVLNRVNAFIKSGKAKGSVVILSSGASNSAPVEIEGGTKQPGNLAPVAQQLKALKDAGAAVALVGTGSEKSTWFPPTQYTNGKRYRVDLTGVNQQLASMASANGAKFLGPLEEYDSGMHSGKGDGVHPYSGYQKLKQAGSAIAPASQSSSGNKPNLDTIAGFKRDGLPIIPAKPELDASGKLTGKSDPRSTTFSITTPTSKRSADVADLQKALLALGYPLPRHGVDGIRGPETNAAIKKFQADNNLEPSGEPNKDTVAKLNDILKTKPEVASKLTKSTLADIGYQPGAGGGTGGGAGATGNAKKAVEYFIAKGWTPEQAAGIVGNLQAESGANLNTAAVGDGGKAYGIAQWHPDRQAKFAKAFGKNISQSDLTDQLAFVQWELDNDEAKAASWLKRAKTADEAAWVFDKYYERSAGLHTSRRVANATALLPTTA